VSAPKGFTDPEKWLQHIRQLGSEEKPVFADIPDADAVALNAAYRKLAHGVADFVDTVRTSGNDGGTFYGALLMARVLLDSAPKAIPSSAIEAELAKYRQQLSSAPTRPDADYGPPKEPIGAPS
jgi:hypothetical protein